MADVSDLSKQELRALADVVELYEKIYEALSPVEAFPRGSVLHIDTEVEPGYLGWVGWGEGGSIVFQPAPPEAKDA